MEVDEIGQVEVDTTMHKMKKCEATGTDEVRLEMLGMAGEVGVKCTCRLLNMCIQEERVSLERCFTLYPEIW